MMPLLRYYILLLSVLFVFSGHVFRRHSTLVKSSLPSHTSKLVMRGGLKGGDLQDKSIHMQSRGRKWLIKTGRKQMALTTAHIATMLTVYNLDFTKSNLRRWSGYIYGGYVISTYSLLYVLEQRILDQLSILEDNPDAMQQLHNYSGDDSEVVDLQFELDCYFAPKLSKNSKMKRHSNRGKGKGSVERWANVMLRFASWAAYNLVKSELNNDVSYGTRFAL